MLQVIQLQNENDDFERQIKDNDNHIQNMFQHFKNVEQELTHTVVSRIIVLERL